MPAAKEANNRLKLCLSVSIRSFILELQSESSLHIAHGVGLVGKPKLRVADRCIPGGKGNVIERVGRIHAQIQTHSIAHPESAPQRRVQAELRRSRNRISRRISPFARGRSRVS